MTKRKIDPAREKRRAARKTKVYAEYGTKPLGEIPSADPKTMWVALDTSTDEGRRVLAEAKVAQLGRELSRERATLAASTTEIERLRAEVASLEEAAATVRAAPHGYIAEPTHRRLLAEADERARGNSRECARYEAGQVRRAAVKKLRDMATGEAMNALADDFAAKPRLHASARLTAAADHIEADPDFGRPKVAT